MNRIIPTFATTVLTLCILLMGCDINSTFHNKDTQPSLSSGKMVDVLADIQIAEAVVKDNILKRDSFKFETIEQYYSTIFTIHEISQDEFDQTMEHYIANPKELHEVYKQVEEKLTDYENENKSKASGAKKRIPNAKDK